MAFSKTFLLVALAFAVLLISAEVSAHRKLAKTTPTTESANTDDLSHRTLDPNHPAVKPGRKGKYGRQGGRGGHGGHGPHTVETETEN
ncbi:uncharacterized protein LOC126799338 [Argentina anserina]|uniref:uncharacterized protein LOC126799338 n=1 Tax=Argentina anserina TaxID=57926 RepID=UPI002176634D|nr:uncharacterized protein LOC126799338 [Potentilla anserina]